MSEQRPESDTDDMASGAAPADNFSSNGTHTESAVAIAEAAEDEEAAPAEVEPTEPEAAGEAAETIEGATDQPTAAATESTATEPATEEVATEPAPDDGTAFLADLVRSMQVAAETERKRIEEDADRRREAHLAAVQARRESEAATMRELAADDLSGINAWAEGERQRIDEERARRTAALQEDLETSLNEHGAKINREIEGVETAIAGYRTEVSAFFATFDEATDPVAIAKQASRRPQFPSLEAAPIDVVDIPTDVDSASGEADSATEGEAPAVGVMDPQASTDGAESWPGWNEGPGSEPSAETIFASDEMAEVEVASEPSASLLQSTSISRPMGWLLGDRHEDRKLDP